MNDARPGPRAALLLAIVAVCGCGGAPPDKSAATDRPPAPVATDGAIMLDSATILRIGLKTAPLTRATRRAERVLPAEVVEDPGAVTTVRSAVGGRLTEAEGHPWPRLGDWLNAETLVAQVGDARPIAVPRAGQVTRVLAQPGELLQPGQVLLELVDYRTALVRVTPEAGESGPPSRLPFASLRGGARWSGAYAGPAPEADPVTHGAAWLYRVAGAASLRPGTALVAYQSAPGASADAVEVPTAAVVQWDALTWVYVERDAGRFLRVPLATDRPVAGGWLVSSGLRPGDRIVVRAAGQLLSEEFRSRITVGQEVGE